MQFTLKEHDCVDAVVLSSYNQGFRDGSQMAERLPDQQATHESPTSLGARKIQPLGRGIQVVALIPSPDFSCDRVHPGS